MVAVFLFDVHCHSEVVLQLRGQLPGAFGAGGHFLMIMPSLRVPPRVIMTVVAVVGPAGNRLDESVANLIIILEGTVKSGLFSSWCSCNLTIGGVHLDCAVKSGNHLIDPGDAMSH